MYLVILLFIIGLFYFGHGIFALRGGSRRSFMRGGRINGFYAELPWGVAFIVGGLWWWNIWPAAASQLFYLAAFGFFLGLSFSVFQPDYLKPAWYRWLETEHGSALPQLRSAAIEMGWFDWERAVQTEAGLKEWVATTLAEQTADE